MKRCPYCAEEIQPEARICRFCGRRVRWSFAYRVFIVLVILAVSFAAYKYERNVRWFFYDTRIILKDMIATLRSFTDAAKDMRTSLKTMIEYKKTMDGTTNEIMQQ